MKERGCEGRKHESVQGLEHKLTKKQRVNKCDIPRENALGEGRGGERVRVKELRHRNLECETE